MAKTLGFYQNFDLVLQRLSSALRCIQEDPEVGHSALAQCMSVNQPVAEGFSSWLRHTGLIISEPHPGSQKRSYKLTPFGKLVYQYDPALTDRGTQWILHYYLATKRDEASDAWYILINKYIPFNSKVNIEHFRSFFADLMGSNTKNQSALIKDPRTALTTYTRPEALAQLRILEKLDNTTFCVRQPVSPPTLVVGFMLLDWWQYHYDETNTLSFSQLGREEESIGRLCLADAGQVRQWITALTGLGYLSFSETQHEPVHRLYQDRPVSLLERYYTQR
ncbi:hypothetical protein KSD_30000 [Ktedonobacter sp. SOSP1-85]|uniref:DUF4007 family protein n=1 Tax=Ktedonobacter sp. SOSP1-85 TaxID=2778367 RepID=UPI001916A93B|nr:DUF4007 family protein [Ktedonobacter sp. SOSP1-85]GHO75229.1 hypothetical protein KSD_30000 [Ktedonobacter sp. SOSP1-85]